MWLAWWAPNAYNCGTMRERHRPPPPLPVIEKFARWVASQGPDAKTADAAAADLLGCSESMVRKIRKGERVPGLDLAFRIETATGRKLRARGWTAVAA